MESIHVMGGFDPAIGIFDGGELGGEGVRTGETGTDLPGGKRNNGRFREKSTALESTEASLFAVVVIVIGGGVIKPRVGKYFMVLGLGQVTASGERGVTRISPSNPKTGGEKSIGTLPKFKVRETLTEGMIGG
jgi:hypothetical protein